ncbi:MAG: ParB/RepB/Spo0J family partition protein [Gemmatimonadetes bacterium]|nr:ParB/RepB/Spo0J family partition protein [Gemmatimonadota bacterium]MCY3942534.1 ParB/RepB/Spo0J family partition protein [Gemmatimonadota bacterium]
MSRHDRLGRGLGALLGEYAAGDSPRTSDEAAPPPKIPLRAIARNPHQPRRDFPTDELSELAASIEANGLLQPIVVRRGKAGAAYELVAGERRLRAARQLGWTEIPAYVRDVDDRALLVLALVENIQREDLGPLEEARGYDELRRVFGLRQREIAEAVGKSRPAVANSLRILALPSSVKRILEEGTISMGHARALLSVEDPIRAAELAREAVAGAWSVRETEKRVRRSRRDASASDDDGDGERRERDPAVAALEDALSEALGARVALRWTGKGAGSIRVSFRDAEELEELFAAIAGRSVAEVVA